MKKSIYIILISSLFLICCQLPEDEHDQNNSEEEVPSVAVTQWTNKMEIFMEYDIAVVGQEIKFITHLTTLSDFQPVREGKVILNFQSTDGTKLTFEKDAILREGIFTPTITFENPGDFDFNLHYQGLKTSESFALGSFKVYASIKDIPVGEEEPAGEEITFLKEQQWKIDFATEEAKVRPVKSAVQAVGEVRPRLASYAEIVSPVEGIISIAHAKHLVNPGQKVRKGQAMAILVPPLTAQNSWADIYFEYDKAKAEFERAKRLKGRNAISEREFEDARRNYEKIKAGFSNYFDSDDSGIRFDSKNQHFIITAPISGIVSAVSILPGQKVNRSQKLFSIVDPAIVWLRFELFSTQSAKLTDISGVSINIPGNDTKINFNESDLTLISRGEIIDPKTRTITLWLEINNRNHQLLIGQTFSAQIYTGTAKELLTVPLSAVYEDNSKKIIFVHISGESFEKRELTVGPIYNDHVAVLSGVTVNERVVNRGGYQVKLASTSEEIGHPHTH